MTTLRSGSWTDVGRRRQQNQDMVLEEDGLFAVADGVGGHAGGDVASDLAVATLRRVYDRRRSVKALEEAIDAANRAVYEKSVEDPDLRHMSTTLVAAAVVDEDGEELLTLASVGDSRIYLWRDGELSQLSDDHSVVGEMVRAGQLTKAEAATHPERNIVTRVIGGQPDVDADIQQLVPYEGDRLLLCSDGLTDEVADDDIAAVLRDEGDPREAARRLVEMANTNGGRDNISVVIVHVTDDDDRAGRASRALEADHDDEPAIRRTGLLTADERNAQLRAISRDEEEDDDASAHDWVTKDQRHRDSSEFDAPQRRLTLPMVLFILGVVLVVAAAFGAVAWYARATYYVGFDEGRVTIFKGRPGGLLWFSPTVEEHTPITEAQVPPADREELDAGKHEPTVDDARRYVENLRERTTPTTTVTTSPPQTAPTATTVAP